MLRLHLVSTFNMKNRRRQVDKQDSVTECELSTENRTTFRLGHHHGEKPDGSVDITKPAAVEPEGDGGLGNLSRLLTDPGTEGGHRRTCMSHISTDF